MTPDTAQPGTGVGRTLAVIAVTAEPQVLETVRAALEHRDDPVDLLHCEDPAQLGTEDGISGVAVIVLQAHANPERAHRELGLVHSLAGSAPILVLDSGDAGLTHAQALENGAWDTIASSDSDALRLRLRQALEVGRVRVELIDAAQRLNQTQRRLDVLLSHGQDARATLVGGRVVDPSAAFARVIGVDDTEAARGIDLIDRVAPHDRERFAETLERVASQRMEAALVFDLTTHLNHRQAVRALLSPGVAEKADAQCTAIVLQSVDSGPRHRDGAHGPALDARMALHNVLSQTATRTKEWILGMVFIGIDGIAALQDQYGLAESDLLLQEAGLYLLDVVRGEDRVFRFGVGEYVMLVERHSASEIEEFAQTLHATFGKQSFGDERHSAALTASVAYCVISGATSQNDARLQQLMNAVYEIHAEGGDAVRKCATGGAQSVDAGDHAAWAARLREALSQDRFSLAYQGISSLAGDSQPYFDVLLRYVDDRGALVRPGEFLPAAEQARMMPDIDRWVVQRAIDVIWQQESLNSHIALFVKLSAPTIENADAFLAWLEDALQARTIPRENLIFSLREVDIRNNARPARKLADDLVAAGFRLALSHYGSTNKAVQVLDGLPAQFVKLAPDFARQILGREEDERLTHIITSAREHDVPLIAEQIEDANSMARLWQAGVNYVQGHFIQEPNTEALATGDDQA